MACGTTLCFFKPVLAVAAVAAIGMGGYNFARTGCLLGSCDAKDANTTLTAVSDAKEPKTGCCPSEREAESTALLASRTETAEGCSDAMRQACEAMGECPEGMMAHCETAGECPMGAQAVQTSLVSDQKVEGECEGASECEKACDGAPKTDCQEAEQTADAESDTETSEG